MMADAGSNCPGEDSTGLELTPGDTVRENSPLPGKTVIVGANGRMGKMLMDHAKKAGLDVIGLDRPFEDAALKEGFTDAELVFLCVPARVVPEVIGRILPCLPPGIILADITSVKERPITQMEKLWSGPVVGTHPLFGPNNDPDSDLPVAIVPGKNAGEEQIAKVESFFGAIGCRVFRCDAETHDRAMARIQNMNFITNLAYFALLAGEEDLLPFLTPSFIRRKDAAAKMLNEDAEMFGGLFEANPHSHEVVRQFRKMLNVAAGGDIDLLCKRAQWWWKEENNKKIPSGK